MDGHRAGGLDPYERRLEAVVHDTARPGPIDRSHPGLFVIRAEANAEITALLPDALLLFAQTWVVEQPEHLVNRLDVAPTVEDRAGDRAVGKLVRLHEVLEADR